MAETPADVKVGSGEPAKPVEESSNTVKPEGDKKPFPRPNKGYYEEQRRSWERAQKEKEVLETGLTGTVKWYSVTGRYGFIERADSKGDTAIAKSTFYKHYLRTLANGEEICFDIVKGRKGQEAANVTGPNGTEVRGSKYYRVLLRYRPRGRVPYHEGKNGGHKSFRRSFKETPEDAEKEKDTHVKEGKNTHVREEKRTHAKEEKGTKEVEKKDDNGEEKRDGHDEEKKPVKAFRRRNKNRNNKNRDNKAATKEDNKEGDEEKKEEKKKEETKKGEEKKEETKKGEEKKEETKKGEEKKEETKKGEEKKGEEKKGEEKKEEGKKEGEKKNDEKKNEEKKEQAPSRRRTNSNKSGAKAAPAGGNTKNTVEAKA